MKKIISRILIILIVLLLLFDFVFASQYRCVYATGPGITLLNGINNLACGIVAIVYTLLKALIVGITYGIQVLMTVTASTYGVNTGEGFWKTAVDTVIDPITPIDIFFNKYKLTGINFFDFEGIEEGSFIYLFRLSVAQWYTIMKLIACAILAVILIYVGVRMALSTIADDKAKYKKMLVDWVVGLLLIFILQYIIIFTIYCNDAIVNALQDAFGKNDMSKLVSESVVKIGVQGIINPGIISFASVLVYIFIVFQTIIFLLAYLKRMVKIGFLIMISPLITITYSIDKMGDGKAQALGNWLKEFVYTILIQPFHCIIYLALAQTAIDLLQAKTLVSAFGISVLDSPEYNQLAAGVLAIMCLKFVNDGEQIVRKIFGFKDDGSTGMGAGAALGVAAIMNAKKIGGATRKSVNNMKAKGKMFKDAFSKDKAQLPIKFSKIGNKFASTSKGQKILNKAKNVTNKAKNVKDKVSNNPAVKKATDMGKNTGKWVSSKKESLKEKKKDNQKNGLGSKIKEKAIAGFNSDVGKYLRSKASLSTALGIMGAAMMYSAGNKSMLEATSAGIGIQKGTQEFFGSSSKTMGNSNDEQLEKMEEYEHGRQIDSKIAIDENGNETFSEQQKKAKQAYKAKKEALAKKANNQQEKESIKKDLENLDDKDPNNQAKIEELKGKLEELDLDGNDIDKEIAEADKTIAKYDAGGNLLKSDGTVYEDNEFDKWKEEAEKKFAAGREQRFRSYKNPPDTKSLDNIKNQIITNLRTMKRNSKGSTNNELTFDEEATISSTAQMLMDSISLGVLKNKGFGNEQQKALIANQLGLDIDGDNDLFEGVDDFFDVTAEYQNYARQSVVAQNFSNVRSYDETGTGIAEDELLNRSLDKFNKKPKSGKSTKESGG